jgi:hypothetical protein
LLGAVIQTKRAPLATPHEGCCVSRKLQPEIPTSNEKRDPEGSRF